MPTKIIKRLRENANVAHVLLMENMVSALGWGGLTSTLNPPVLTGIDGETLAAQPDRFMSPSGPPFLPTHVGMWLSVYGSEFVNNGTYKIIGVPSATEVVLSGGVYGPSFVDDIGMTFRIVDPALNLLGNYFVVQGKVGSSPLWQAKFSLVSSSQIDIEVSPLAGWSGLAWTLPVPATVSLVADVGTPSWYFLLDDTGLRAWTENAAGTAVLNMAYVGTIESRRPSFDTHPVVSLAGDPSLSLPGSLADIKALAPDDATPVAYSALTYGDFTSPNMFSSLPPSQFDLRNDSARIPIGLDSGGFKEDDRGYLYGVRYISDQIPYRSFVDNGRSLVSLGTGVAFDWDGSLSR